MTEPVDLGAAALFEDARTVLRDVVQAVSGALDGWAKGDIELAFQEAEDDSPGSWLPACLHEYLDNQAAGARAALEPPEETP